MNDIAIECKQLKKQFADKTVLSNIDLVINKGEFFGLVGMNGSGKSTMIKSILDLISINSGSINLFGVSHREVSSRSKVSYLPDRFMPPSHLTPMDFIQYILELHKIEYDETEILPMLESLELDQDKLKVSVSQLSKGMTQKVGLASTLLSNKELLVLDEPMSGLDPKARVLFKQLLEKRKEKNTTVFFSSHVLADVDEIADKMAILHEGHLKFVGTPKDFKKTYNSDVLEDAYMKCINQSA